MKALRCKPPSHTASSAKSCVLSQYAYAEIGLSRKFWSAKNFGPGSKIFGKIGPGGHVFLKKLVLIQKSWSAVLYIKVVTRRARCISSSRCRAFRSPVLRPRPTAVFVVASPYVQLVRYHSLSQRSGLCG